MNASKLKGNCTLYIILAPECNTKLTG